MFDIQSLVLLTLIVLSPVFVLFASFAIVLVIYLVKGYRFKKSESTYKKPSILKRIYIDFPLRFWLDTFARDPNEFQEQGLHLFCGEQGSGKTISVTEILQRLQARYKKLKVRTNFNYAYQDGELKDWRELVSNENGVYGQVEVIDEIQTWFNSMQSKDFPPEMLTEISQQRKQRKMLIGTAQIFGRVAKPIREQVSFVYCPITIAGCLTIVRVSKPIYYDEENFRFKRYIRNYFFVHSNKIRDSFDTYKKIEGLTKSGFNLRMDLRSDAKA